MMHKSHKDTYLRKKSRNRRNIKKYRYFKIVVILVILAGIAYGTKTIYGKESSEYKNQEEVSVTPPPSEEPEHETEDTTNQEGSKDSEKKDDSSNPEITKEPEATEVPEVTKEPEATKVPEATQGPEITKEPEVTKVPEVTEKPGISNGTDVPMDSSKDSFFDDAVFIGDSRTDGFGVYSGLKNATFYAEKGLMVNTILTEKVAKVDGQKMTVFEALEKKSFGKIYIMFGVNELGWPYESVFIKKYTKLVESIKELQPQADIYVQSIIHINSKKIKSPQPYHDNKLIDQRNKLIKEMAQELDVTYLDLNSVLTDEKGSLYYEASSDGIHLNKEYCKVWKNYLLENKKGEGETQ